MNTDPLPANPAPFRKRRPYTFVLAGLVGALLLGGALALGSGSPADVVAPGIRVGGTDLGGLNRADAMKKLLAAQPATPQIAVSVGSTTWTVPADQLGWSLDTEAGLKAAIQASSERTLLQKMQTFVGQAPVTDLALPQKVDAAQAKAGLAALTASQNTLAKNASVAFEKIRYVVKPGAAGVQVQLDPAVQNLVQHPDLRTLSLNVVKSEPRYTTQGMQTLIDQGNALVRPLSVKLGSGGQAFTLTPLQVANLYWVRQTGLEIDQDTLAAKVKQISSTVDRPAQNARYELKGGALVKVAEQPGMISDPAQTQKLLSQAVLDPKITSIVLTPKVSQPTLKLADLPDASKLTLIATGKSTYYHSSAARRVNITNAAAKINGAVVAPGENFSFLDNLGGISPENGFVTGLIISAGRTVDGLGGGVCQVSTTTFRALYQAGLPVVERNQHAYRVGYYEPQVGYEAAVYDPGKDLKMKNDTGGPILVKTINDNARSTLTVQVWGLPQTRTVSVSPATILSHTGHPAAKYVPSADLPRGAVKQVDWAADGYNLYITRTIRDKGAVRTDKTTTSYKPWQAVYEVGQ
ncbi:VanW family protein [Deinococcus altitudinis]|uniref:VanW family protein n=1 Tax=Deinococcus altitudinis TaxID=468914 RepID=UPI0038928633